MKRYTATEAANELGTDAKTLRRLLRSSDTFQAPGSGGSWSFSTADLPKLKAMVEAHQAKPSGKGRGHTIKDAPGLSKADAQDPDKVRAITQERVDRLEEALKAKGLHISQMRDAERFATPPASLMKNLAAVFG